MKILAGLVVAGLVVWWLTNRDGPLAKRPSGDAAASKVGANAAIKKAQNDLPTSSIIKKLLGDKPIVK